MHTKIFRNYNLNVICNYSCYFTVLAEIILKLPENPKNRCKMISENGTPVLVKIFPHRVELGWISNDQDLNTSTVT